MIVLAAVASAHVPVIYVTSPSEDWCAVANATVGNDFVMLVPGEYRGPCRLQARPSDIDAELTTLQSLDPDDPAVFVGSDTDVVLELGGERLILLEVTFRGLQAGVDAVRLAGAEEGWIRQVTFEDVPGTAVALAGPDTHVTGSTFRRVGTAIAAGCADGTCPTALELSENLVVGADVGLRLFPGAAARARDDVFGDVVRGIVSAGTLSSDGDLVEATHTALELGTGPATVADGVFAAPTPVRTAPGAADVVLVADTFFGRPELPGWSSGRGLRFASSALDRALPDLGGADTAGSVGCPDPARCFTDAAALDAYPVAGAPLVGAGVGDPAARADWCGHPRGEPPTVGAFEWVGEGTYGPIPIAAKREFSCALPAPSGHTGSPGSTADTGRPPDPPTDGIPPPVVRPGAPTRCGCRATPAGPGAAALGLLAGLVATRRRHTGPRLDRVSVRTGASAVSCRPNPPRNP